MSSETSVRRTFSRTPWLKSILFVRTASLFLRVRVFCTYQANHSCSLKTPACNHCTLVSCITQITKFDCPRIWWGAEEGQGDLVENLRKEVENQQRETTMYYSQLLKVPESSFGLWWSCAASCAHGELCSINLLFLKNISSMYLDLKIRPRMRLLVFCCFRQYLVLY